MNTINNEQEYLVQKIRTQYMENSTRNWTS